MNSKPPSSMIDVKPWGIEQTFANNDSYIGKLLIINAGSRTSLHYHEEKTKTITVLDGLGLYEFENADGKMIEGAVKQYDTIHIVPGTRHRFTAWSALRLSEVSTPHPEDSIRVEDDYGRAEAKIEKPTLQDVSAAVRSKN